MTADTVTTEGINFIIIRDKILQIGKEGKGLCSGFVTNEAKRAIYHILSCPFGFPNAEKPYAIKEAIEAIIIKDIDEGKKEAIHHIGVNPYRFIQLWCSGNITLEQMQNASETDYYIEVSNVTFCDETWTLRVYWNPDFSFASCTEDGEVV